LCSEFLTFKKKFLWFPQKTAMAELMQKIPRTPGGCVPSCVHVLKVPVFSLGRGEGRIRDFSHEASYDFLCMERILF